jgi:signal transduction histidine kinase/DNA-binding response OmpR family regulator
MSERSAPADVLVVDDEPEIVAPLVEFLAQQGYRVHSADSVAATRQALDRHDFAIVFLDLMLGDGSGVDVLREAQGLADPPEFVMVTGHATLDSALAAMEAGAAGYVLKPVDFRRLTGLLDRVLERRKLAAENARLQSELTERLRESEALLGIARTLGETLDVREALRRICRELARVTGADSAAAYLYDAAQDLLQPYAAYRAPAEHLATLAATPLPLRSEGFFLPVWRAQQPVFSDDVTADTRFHHPLFRAIPHQSALLLPLILNGEVAGAFYLVWWKARRLFEERELTLLENVGRQVGILLRNARLFDEAERDRRRLRVLNEVSERLAALHDTAQILSLIVNEAVTLLGVEGAGVRLREGDELVVGAVTESAAPVMTRPRLRVGESLSGTVVATGEPVVVEDVTEDRRDDDEHRRAAAALGYHGFAAVPLRTADGVIGVLSVYARARRRLLPDEISLLTTFADQASLAVERSRLLQATQAREREATKLYTITAQLASDFGVDRVLDLVTAGVLELLGCDAASVYSFEAGLGGLRFRCGRNLDPRLTRDLVLRPGEGVAGLAFAERRPVWTRDRLHDSLTYSPATTRLVQTWAPRAFLAVPIVRRDEVFGVLVAYFAAPHDFTPDDVRLLSTLAVQGAIAVDNSILFEETRTQQVRLSQIFESTSDGIMLIDHAGRVAAANALAAELLQTGVRVGDTLQDILGTTPVSLAEAWPEVLREMRALPPTGWEGDVETPAPAARALHWVARPTLDAAGTRVGVTLTLQDVTRDREVSRMKSDFVSFVTHQLRTPLAGIKWLLELAAEDPSLPEEARGYVSDSREAAERLIKLVNELLDISRLESGRLTITPVSVDLGAMTREVLAELAGLIEAKGHTATCSGTGTVIADQQLLRQVVVNLMSNAVKYTPPGGTITVRIAPDGDTVAWSITDTGIGVPVAARARLFEKFYRADNVHTLETEGTGLGLYLVRLILDQFQGQVRYDSTEGGGSTFTVTLPMGGAVA